eukprot:4994713-Pyramimonas_sp.AAC.1
MFEEDSASTAVVPRLLAHVGGDLSTANGGGVQRAKSLGAEELVQVLRAPLHPVRVVVDRAVIEQDVG